MDQPTKPRLLTSAEAAELVKLNKRTLDSMRWQGVGPPFSKHGGRIVYRHAHLKAWSENAHRRAAPRPLKMRRRPLLGILAALALVLASPEATRLKPGPPLRSGPSEQARLGATGA